MSKTSIAIAALLVTAAAGIAYEIYDEHRKQNHAISIILGSADHEGILKKNKQLAPIVAAQFRDYKTNSILWSGAHHATLFVSTFLAAMAALILKMESWPANWDDKRRKDYAALFAALSALLISVSTSGGFQAKWQASRMAAANTGSIAFDLLKQEDGVPVELISHLQDIFIQQNQAIVRESSSDVAAEKASVPPAHDRNSSTQ